MSSFDSIDTNEYNDRTHLDSHANTIVYGKFCWVFADSGFKADDTPFCKKVGKMLQVPIVDALILYENPLTGEKFILITRNALYVPSMNHNLIPPFIMREAGIEVNDKAKIHCPMPTEDDHAIIDRKTGIHICLSIDNTFSIFPSSKPTTDDTYDINIPLITIS